MELPNRLPPGPSRSRPGYLDYAGWSDGVRFTDLRCLLQHYSLKRYHSDDQVFSREADYAGKWKERRTALSFVEIVSGLEAVPTLACGRVRP